MRILLTGANGQLGRELQPLLANEDLVLADQPEFELTDLCLSRRIIDSRPDVCIHVGAYTDVEGCERDPDRAFRVNAGGTKNVAEAAAQLGAYLIYLSTDYVFDGRKREPYIESDAPNPLSAYGRSKLKGEHEVLSCRSPSLIIRSSWLYGLHGANFVKTILRAATSQGEIRVVSDQRGSPTSARELAGVIVELIRQKREGVVHAGGAGGCSWHEFADAILQELEIPCRNVPISTAESGRVAVRPAYSVVSTERLNSYGVWLSPWRIALKDFLREYASASSAPTAGKPNSDA